MKTTNVFLKLYENSEVFFYIGWIIMLVNICLFYSSTTFNLSFLTPIALCCFMLKIIFTKRYKLIELLICFLLLLVGLFSYIKSQDNRVLWLSIVIFSLKNIDIEKIIRLTFYIMLGLVICFILLFLIGITSQPITNKGGMAFGLGHPNNCHCYFAILSSLFIYINFNNIKIKKYIILLNIANIILFVFTLSRSGVMVFASSSLFLLLILFFKKYSNMISIIYVICIFIAIITLILLIFFYNTNPIISLFNDLLSNRLIQANFYKSYYGIHPFGQYLGLLHVPSPKAYLDIGYAKILINNGFVPFIIIFLSYISLAIKFIKNNYLDKLYLIIVFITYLCIENVATFIFMNISFLWFSELIFNDNYIFKGKLSFLNYNSDFLVKRWFGE